MPQFMLLIMENAVDERLDPAVTKALVEGRSAYERRLREVAAFVDGGELRPSVEAKRVSRRDGQVEVESGPFARALGGYYVIEASDLDAAAELAKTCPISPGTLMEVRPLMKGKLRADKSDQPGQVFAFSVQKSAASEPEWIEVMDRIDALTGESVPGPTVNRDGEWLGGVRLEAPSRGRRLTPASETLGVVDGPFAESKEVIGGLFFWCLSSMDAAVGWAGHSEYVEHGVLEIRELWRS